MKKLFLSNHKWILTEQLVTGAERQSYEELSYSKQLREKTTKGNKMTISLVSFHVYDEDLEFIESQLSSHETISGWCKEIIFKEIDKLQTTKKENDGREINGS